MNQKILQKYLKNFMKKTPFMNDLAIEISALKDITHEDIDTWIHIEKGVAEEHQLFLMRI